MDSVRQVKEPGNSKPSTSDQVNSATDVENADMAAVCAALASEFESASGKTIAITGAAGFLGFYLSKSLCYWNSQVSPKEQIKVILLDAFMRGRPAWIDELENEANCKVLTRNVIDPVPAELADVDYIIHAASIASPMFYREHPIETMDANVTGLRLAYCISRPAKFTAIPMPTIFRRLKPTEATCPALAPEPAMTNPNVTAKRCA